MEQYDMDQMTEKEILFAILKELQAMREMSQMNVDKFNRDKKNNERLLEQTIGMLPKELQGVFQSIMNGGKNG